MAGHSVRARRPAGSSTTPVSLVSDPDILAAYLEDAAHFPDGHAAAIASPTSESEVAALLRDHATILTVGAQSSLTGGATPMGEILLSTARMTSLDVISSTLVRVGAGVSLATLDAALARRGSYYPPSPTYIGAFVGGTVATNAAGAATFKYGTTRQWVEGLTVVLSSGDVLDVERGQVRAHRDGYFEFELARGMVRVPVPRYVMPDVPKLSAGYFSAPGMDLVDLFVGSEGTLGVITTVTLRVVPERPAFCLAFAPFTDRAKGMEVVRRLRDDGLAARATNGTPSFGVSAIEHLDARSLSILCEDGVDRLSGVLIAERARLALIVTIELSPAFSADEAYTQIGQWEEVGSDAPLARFCALMADAAVLDDVEVAVPGDEKRAAQILALREGVPAGVNARVGRAKQTIDRRIEKTAADLVVPFDRFDALVAFCEQEFQRRGLDLAIWGHVSDGNIHPNLIPRSFDDVAAGKEAVLACGREAVRLGGAPLAEHGVGRNPVKQQLLHELYGDAGIEEMRRVKRALDPSGTLAPGVLFPPSP